MEHVPIGRVVSDCDDAERTGLPVLLASRAYWQAMIDGPANDGRQSAGSSAELDLWCDCVEHIDKELERRGIKAADVVALERRVAVEYHDRMQMCPCGKSIGHVPWNSWRELAVRGCVQVEDTQLWHCGPACPAIDGKALRVLPQLDVRARGKDGGNLALFVAVVAFVFGLMMLAGGWLELAPFGRVGWSFAAGVLHGFGVISVFEYRNTRRMKRIAHRPRMIAIDKRSVSEKGT